MYIVLYVLGLDIGIKYEIDKDCNKEWKFIAKLKYFSAFA